MSLGANIRAGGAFVELFALNNMDKGLRAAENRLRQTASIANGIGMKMAGVGLAIAGPMVMAAREFMETGASILLMSQRTGIGVTALSELLFAAKQSGVEIGDFEKAMGRMAVTLQHAADGSIDAIRTLRSFGITLEEIKNLSGEQILLKFADNLQAIGNPQSRMERIREAFGRGAGGMINLFDGGAAGLQAKMNRSDFVGGTWTLDQAKAALELKRSFNEATVSIFSVGRAIGDTLAPLLRAVMEEIMGTVAQARAWIAENNGTVKAVLLAAAGVTALGGAFLGLGVALNLATLALAPFRLITTLLGSVAFFAAPLAPLALIAGAVYIILKQFMDIDSLVGKIGGNISEALDLRGIQGAFVTLGQTIEATWQALSLALSNNDWASAVQIMIVGLKMGFQGFFDWFKTSWAAGVVNVVRNGVLTLGAIGRQIVGEDGFRDLQRLREMEQRAAHPRDAVLEGLELRRRQHVQAQVERDPGVIQAREDHAEALLFLRNPEGADNALRAEMAAARNRVGQTDPMAMQLARQIAARRGELEGTPEMQQLRAEMQRLTEAQQQLFWDRKWNEAMTDGPPRAIIPDIDQTRAKTDVGGTFNAAALFGLGATSVEQQQLEALNRIARNTERREQGNVQTV